MEVNIFQDASKSWKGEEEGEDREEREERKEAAKVRHKLGGENVVENYVIKFKSDIDRWLNNWSHDLE